MPPSPDEEHYANERRQMVDEQLARRGIRDAAVLDAMRRIPRERFVLPAYLGSAYCDGALPIDCGQTVSQPYMVGRMTELLALRPEHAVLEVGTGSGYQTAILACIAQHVYTMEWHSKLMSQAAERLAVLDLDNVSYRCGDGSVGWPEHAPFDAIMVTAGAPDVPQPLCDQLKVGGRLVVPAGPEGDQTLVLVRRTAAGYERDEVLKCRFVKLLGTAGWRT